MKQRSTPETPEQTIRKRDIIAYGMGGFASTMPNQFRLQFSMNFLTDVAGLNIGSVGVWTMLLSVWDAINDPLIGRWVDQTDTRLGKYRPHMIAGSLCWAVTILLLFTVPDLSPNGLLLYYIVILALFSVFFTQFTIPWQALNSILSRDVHQRNLLLTSRQLIGAVATSAVGLFVIPVVSKFSDPHRGWMTAAGIVAVICVIFALLSAASAKRWTSSTPFPLQSPFAFGNNWGRSSIIRRSSAPVCCWAL